MARFPVTYRIRSDAGSIERRAQAIAVEQSVEVPLSVIDDRHVLRDVVGRVGKIADRGDGTFDVEIALSVETTGLEPGQLLNMLFGNTSIHEDVVLQDATFSNDMLAAFGGPQHGLQGLRVRCGADGRAMTCAALKPQGLPCEALAALAHKLALGGVDFIKDDHGLADQTYSPYASRIRACARAVREACGQTGGRTHYLPSLSGNLDQLRAQLRLAREEGLDTALIAPMVVGLASFHALVREFPDMAFFAHPAMAGASRIAPPFLFGKLLRLMGADASIFPNYGGRFGYTRETCGALATTCLAPLGGLRATAPVPAGGMTLDRVGEMLDLFGRDAIVLIGGDLLAARARLTEEAAAFHDRVAHHVYA
jgi:ribulose-bisphosphate carboxylase large chain